MLPKTLQPTILQSPKSASLKQREEFELMIGDIRAKLEDKLKAFKEKQIQT